MPRLHVVAGQTGLKRQGRHAGQGHFADIGAGSGRISLMMAGVVQETGKVIAVDLIEATMRISGVPSAMQLQLLAVL